jgi:hypothetical protein
MSKIIVEDGTQVANANSYVSTGFLIKYAADRGVSLDKSPSVLLISAMDYVEYLNYKGYRVSEEQALQFPRYEVPKDERYNYDSDEIPKELQEGLCEVAMAIDAGNDPLQDICRTTIKEKVGEIEVQYKESSASTTIVRKINNKLAKLLEGGSGSGSIMFSVDKA